MWCASLERLRVRSKPFFPLSRSRIVGELLEEIGGQPGVRMSAGHRWPASFRQRIVSGKSRASTVKPPSADDAGTAKCGDHFAVSSSCRLSR